ncbi:hypothetical protein IFM89_009017 [Coptis chinensis]|uniref:Uncharacterized protein n=1 Tax=Coptis chinensis TaxID=261450 RepID=A0A835I1G1_9MAGN|nr:hypothetical protein IFM89_009017 [Coptis chinensis]
MVLDVTPLYDIGFPTPMLFKTKNEHQYSFSAIIPPESYHHHSPAPQQVSLLLTLPLHILVAAVVFVALFWLPETMHMNHGDNREGDISFESLENAGIQEKGTNKSLFRNWPLMSAVFSLWAVSSKTFGLGFSTNKVALALFSQSLDQKQGGAANGIAMTGMSLFRGLGLAIGGFLVSWTQKRQDTSFLPVVETHPRLRKQFWDPTCAIFHSLRSISCNPLRDKLARFVRETVAESILPGGGVAKGE